MMSLDDLAREVHVWALSTETISESDLAHIARALPKEEQSRAKRFAFAKDYRSYILAHGLLRVALSNYHTIQPSAWTFSRGLFGKPEIEHPISAQGLRFNLSHTAGWVVCAVTTRGEVGVDVETVRELRFLELAHRFFAPQEAEELAALPTDQQRDAFFRVWTLKEAYIKALGKGLTADLSEFAFREILGEEITISFRNSEDRPGIWKFFRHEPDDRHKIAAAIHVPNDQSVMWRWILRETLPELLSES